MDIVINEIANLKVGLFANMVLTLIGIVIYNICELMATKKLKSINDFVFSLWWYDNNLKFIASCLIISCLFWLSASYNVLTADKALLLGLVGNLLVSKMIAFLQKNNA